MLTSELKKKYELQQSIINKSKRNVQVVLEVIKVK